LRGAGQIPYTNDAGAFVDGNLNTILNSEFVPNMDFPGLAVFGNSPSRFSIRP